MQRDCYLVDGLNGCQESAYAGPALVPHPSADPADLTAEDLALLDGLADGTHDEDGAPDEASNEGSVGSVAPANDLDRSSERRAQRERAELILAVIDVGLRALLDSDAIVSEPSSLGELVACRERTAKS